MTPNSPDPRPAGLDRAELVGQRDLNPEKIAAMADIRPRMFTLVMHRQTRVDARRRRWFARP